MAKKAIEFEGVGRVLRAIQDKKIKGAKGLVDGLEKAANILLRKSLQLVPKASGALADSAKVEKGGINSAIRAWATVSYHTHYAIFVHENPFMYHTPPTQWRYLADAVLMVKGAMTRAIHRSIAASVIGTTPYRDLPWDHPNKIVDNANAVGRRGAGRPPRHPDS